MESATQRLGRWTQTSEILRVESAKRGFDRLADADDSFFHAWTKKRDPKVAAKEQPRPARRRGTTRMRRAVKFHSLHRRGR